ncbi:hypothetical protein HDU85_007286 [Gaertneriomyces sp. JEL0708]|nr:hypothetical protein HDU85_007286 [Gaertneriomyces sp. JEL0708]
MLEATTALRGRWSRVKLSGGLQPSPRFGHRCVVVRTSSDSKNSAKSKTGGYGTDTKVALIWGSNSKYLLCDSFLFHSHTSSWTKLRFSGQPSDERDSWDGTGAASMAVTSFENHAYIFGGIYDAGGIACVSDELLRYDAMTGALEQIHWQGDGPQARAGASLTYLPEGSTVDPTLFLFGGLDGTGAYLDDAWIFNLRTQAWGLIKVRGEPPSPRSDHTAVYWPGKGGFERQVIIHGGMRSDPVNSGQCIRLDDTVVFDLHKSQWYRPPVSESPPGRARHTAHMYGTKMLVFGGAEGIALGEGERKYSNSAYAFDIETAQWQELTQIDADGGSLPAPRAGHGSALIGNKVYVFSGETGYSQKSGLHHSTNDVWCLDLASPLAPVLHCEDRSVPGDKLILTWNTPSGASTDDRVYQIFLRRPADPPNYEDMVYEGNALGAVVTTYSAPDKSTRTVAGSEEYRLRLITKKPGANANNEAGTSAEWEQGSSDICIVPAVPKEPPVVPKHLRAIELQVNQDDLPAQSLPLHTSGKPWVRVTWDPSPTSNRYVLEASGHVPPVALSKDAVVDAPRVSSQGIEGNAHDLAANLTWKDVYQGKSTQWDINVDDLCNLITIAGAPPTGGRKTVEMNGDATSDDSFDQVSMVFYVRVRAVNVVGESEPSKAASVDMRISRDLIRSDASEPTLPPLMDVPTPPYASTDNGPAIMLNMPGDTPPGDDLIVQGKAEADAEDEEVEKEEEDEEEEEEEEMMTGSVGVVPDGPRSSNQHLLSRAASEESIDFATPESRSFTNSPAPMDTDTMISAGIRDDVPNSNPDSPASASVKIPKKRGRPRKSDAKSTPTRKRSKREDSVSELDLTPKRQGSRRISSRDATPLADMQLDVMPLLPLPTLPYNDLPADVRDEDFVRDEEGRPQLGNPANGFHFNLLYGNKLEILSDSEGPEVWYSGRALVYAPCNLPNGRKTWKVKVHFQGYPKRQDEPIVLDAKGRAGLRPVTGKPDVMLGPPNGSRVQDEDDKFHPDSKKLWYPLNSDQRKLVKQGGVVVVAMI